MQQLVKSNRVTANIRLMQRNFEPTQMLQQIVSVHLQPND
jgi:hypothetical protein